MPDLLLLVPALASLLLLIWAVRVQFILWQMQRDLGYAPRRRRGSNPPPPGRKPAPPAGPPKQPLTAQLIRYWAWEQEQVRRAWFDPRMGEPWPEDHKPAPPAGQAAPTLRSAVKRLLEAIIGLGDVDDAVQFARAALDADEVRLDKGSTQRGNGSGGPTPPNPPVYGWGPGQLNPPPPGPGMRRVYLDQPSQMAECGGPCWETQDPRCCDCGALCRDVPAVHAKPQPHGGRLIKSWEEPSPPSEP
jgi:hypothetical protein